MNYNSSTVTDAAWVSDAWVERNRGLDAAETAPEICVDVMSTYDTNASMRERAERYLQLGARDARVVNTQGERIVYVPETRS